MKIRSKNNQIRFRIQPTEQEQLLSGAALETELHFPANTLKFSLKIGDQPQTSADYENDTCIVTLSKFSLETWSQNPKEIIKFAQENALGNAVIGTIELDLMRDK